MFHLITIRYATCMYCAQTREITRERMAWTLSLTRTMTQSEVVYDWNLQVKLESRDQTRACYTEYFLSEVSLGAVQ